MTISNNELIKSLLDEFTNPYHNDEVIELMEKINPKFISNFSNDFQNYLISQKGKADLEYNYDLEDLKKIKQAIKDTVKIYKVCPNCEKRAMPINFKGEKGNLPRDKVCTNCNWNFEEGFEN